MSTAAVPRLASSTPSEGGKAHGPISDLGSEQSVGRVTAGAGRARTTLLGAAAAAALALLAPSTASAHVPRRPAGLSLDARAAFQLRVIRHDEEVIRWFSRRGIRFALAYSRPRAGTAEYALWWHSLQQRWVRRELGETREALAARAERRRAAEEAQRASALPPHYSEWMCIHGGEGSWDADTGNGYYGGLQMDKEFQRAYGGGLLRLKGTADHWTPLEQMWAAERAYNSGRGYSPWPNTARNCGLL